MLLVKKSPGRLASHFPIQGQEAASCKYDTLFTTLAKNVSKYDHLSERNYIKFSLYKLFWSFETRF